jgi:type IV pilus assembly protein PilN
MIRVNLLPWRERSRARQKKQKMLSLLIGVIFLVLTLFIICHHIEHLIVKQRQDNLHLEEKIATIDKRLVLQALASRRMAFVYGLTSLADTIPSGVFLTHFEQHQNQIELMGLADSSASISRLVQNITRQVNFNMVSLPEIKHMKSQGFAVKQQFKLRLTVRKST